ncbi:ABC transporter ATP-binding protein [Streptobacillus moniliformis]|uniref:ABC transporter related protein n=1 Tax=Streptobacillus moniliformis (strain ATCC 14647 / DSM 12112 / NCTC 10651 / 9901) TaxID=519441 RepID=D1AV42_STRM9|nr:ABC transporter ATP-binding protein [Streptobacillus moniliformis]ACZ01602.1 ABC transporter related protein [Streptobacillus moniliformis DSM 12112]SQA13225.1 Glutamine transport ATP-binding protein GlnQ [Streptobacillus moniliformis]
MSSIIKIEHLFKNYGNKAVLKDINLEINQGEILSILGKNGVGKTTLLSIILKMIEASSGNIKFRNVDIRDINNKKYYSDINIVLENSQNIYYYMTGLENILYFGSLYGYNKEKILTNVNNWIDLFELRDAINKKVSIYSRGMIQKLSIIIALINKPKLLLLDEPTLGLDVYSKRKMMDMIKILSEKENITIILTIHQMDIVEYLDSKLILLDKGEVVYVGRIDDLKTKYTTKQYIVKYSIDDITYEEKILKENFEEIYMYLKSKKVDEIYEIKKYEKSLEELILEME